MTPSSLSRRHLAFVALVLLTLWPSLAPALTPLPPVPARPGADAGPTKVFYTMWISDVSRIDSVGQTFTASFGLLLRWQDHTLRHAGPGVKQYALSEIWHPPFLFANEGTDTKRSLPELADVSPDGEVILRQRYLGSFTQLLKLRTFPFDRETFRMQLVALGHRPEDIVFEPDPLARAAGMPLGIGRADEVTLQDWQILSVSAAPRPYSLSPGVQLAGLSFEFVASRNSHHYVVKVIIPLLLIIMMSWAVFWIDPSETGPQFSIAVTSMLTLIAYRFAIEANIPKLPYLTRMDSFIFTATVLVFLSLIEVLIVSKMAKQNKIEDARAIDRRCRWLFPLVFTLASIVIFY